MDGRTPSEREEELLGLLAGLPNGNGGDYGSSDGRELSFSDLLVIDAAAASARPSGAAESDDGRAPAPREGDRRSKASSPPGKPQQQQAAPAARETRRQRRQRSGGSGRGSCGGGGDGVLLNFYVPGLLTRSMTAPRPERAAVTTMPPGPAPAKGAAAGGKARAAQAPLGIGCWPALWRRGGRGDRRSTTPAKACS